MHATIQFFTKKGFYGAPLTVKAASVRDVWKQLDKAFDKIPDEIEGEKFINWTNIAIEIAR